MDGRVVLRRVVVMAYAMLLACAIVWGFGMAQAHAVGTESYSAATGVQASTQAKASASCALLRKDGNIWRCTSKGKPVSKYWSGNKSLSSQLNKVRTIFVASNVTSVTSISYTWARSKFSSGRSSDYRYTTSLAGSYFKNVKTMKFLTNSAGVNKCKAIGDRAFAYSPNIARFVNFNKTKVIRIGQWAFSRSKVAGISFPKTLKTIDKYAFYNCANLAKVSGLAKTKLSTLGSYAFASSAKLKSIALPSACQVVGDYAFYECAGLKSATLGSATTKVGDGAFNNCESLAAISLPATCKELGYSAFSGCSSLTKVTMNSDTVVTHAADSSYSMYSQFKGTPLAIEGDDACFYVPESLLPDYQSDSASSPWYDYHTKFKAI